MCTQLHLLLFPALAAIKAANWVGRPAGVYSPVVEPVGKYVALLAQIPLRISELQPWKRIKQMELEDILHLIKQAQADVKCKLLDDQSQEGQSLREEAIRQGQCPVSGMTETCLFL